MATMEQIDANLGIEQNKVFTDRDFGFKEAELQEQWRSRGQLDQVPVLARRHTLSAVGSGARSRIQQEGW